MPDIWVDSNTAIIIPVNILPLIDDTDFKTVEEAIVYNSTGIQITWNFCTTAGVVTQTAITPTTGGLHDWAEPLANVGMYTIEIPTASGDWNNDGNAARIGTGWITGKATGVLPWRGPTIGIRAAALNNSMVDGATVDVNVTAISGDTTAADNCELAFDTTGYGFTGCTMPTTTTVTNGVTLGADAITAAKIADDAFSAEHFATNCLTDDAVADSFFTVLADDADVATAVWANATGAAVYAAVVTNATGADIGADTTSLLTQVGTAGAGLTAIPTVANVTTVATTTNLTNLPAAAATAAELAKVPKSDSTVSWNATALAAIQAECTDAFNAYDPPTATEMTAAFTEIKGATWAATDTLEGIHDDVATVDGVVDGIVTTIAGFATVNDIADAVHDEALSGHTTAGTAGKALADIETDVTAILEDTGTTLPTAIADVPTVAEFEARTLPSADYVVTTDTIAGVTTVATTTSVTNDVGITQAGADKVWGTTTRTLTAIDEDSTTLDIDAAITGALGTGSGLTTLATAAELAKVPKSDGAVTWNATALASINAEVDTAFNTAIPGSPTADSINERVKAIDVLTEASGAGDLAAILTDTGTTIPGTITTMQGNVTSILEDTGTTLPAQITALVESGIKKNTELPGFSFMMYDDDDHVTPKTGATVTATRSIDGAAFASCTNAVSEISNGWYKITLAAADLNGDVIALKFTATDADPVGITLKTSS